MPDGNTIRLYWDACCFLHYINETPEHLPLLERLLTGASDSGGKLIVVTSMISKVEVAFAAQEQLQGALNDQQERRIDKLWRDYTAVIVAEFYEQIALEARDLVRQAAVQKPKLSLQAADAIHLATAKRLQVKEFQTYEDKLLNPIYERLTGLTIREPSEIYVPYKS